MEEWNDAQEDVLGLQIGMLDGRIDVGLQIAVGEHHALGQSGCARGVHQDGQIVGSRRGEFGSEACAGGNHLRKLLEVDDFQRQVFEAAGELRNGDDGIDAGILDHVGNFAIAQKIIDRDDALARQQSSVETGRKSGTGRKQQSDVRFLRLAGDVHAQPGGHAGNALIGPLPEIVGHGQILRVGSGVGEKWFKEHVLFIAKERQGCERVDQGRFSRC